MCERERERDTDRQGHREAARQRDRQRDRGMARTVSAIFSDSGSGCVRRPRQPCAMASSVGAASLIPLYVCACCACGCVWVWVCVCACVCAYVGTWVCVRARAQLCTWRDAGVGVASIALPRLPEMTTRERSRTGLLLLDLVRSIHKGHARCCLSIEPRNLGTRPEE